MPFTSIPEPYGSVYSPLVYDYEVAAPVSLLDLTVVDTNAGEAVALKRFCDTQKITLDLSAVARRLIRFAPLSRPTGLASDPARCAAVRVETDAVSSPLRRFYAARFVPQPPCLLTSQPSERLLRRNERDELTLLVPSACSVVLVQTAEDGSRISTETFTQSLAGTVPALFTLAAGELDERTAEATVEIFAGERSVASLAYRILPEQTGLCRAAWRSDAGSIEHHTFRIADTVVETLAKAEDATLLDRSVSIRLVSDYMTRSQIESLLEIRRAPQVWIVRQEEYLPVQVGQGAHPIYDRHAPLRAEIVVCHTETRCNR